MPRVPAGACLWVTYMRHAFKITVVARRCWRSFWQFDWRKRVFATSACIIGRKRELRRTRLCQELFNLLTFWWRLFWLANGVCSRLKHWHDIIFTWRERWRMSRSQILIGRVTNHVRTLSGRFLSWTKWSFLELNFMLNWHQCQPIWVVQYWQMMVLSTSSFDQSIGVFGHPICCLEKGLSWR